MAYKDMIELLKSCDNPTTARWLVKEISDRKLSTALTKLRHVMGVPHDKLADQLRMKSEELSEVGNMKTCDIGADLVTAYIESVIELRAKEDKNDEVD